MQLHFAAVVKDVDGNGRNLIQHNYISLKKDVMQWLKENGRLPSFTTQEYFDEINSLNKYKEENMTLKEENQEIK